MVRTQNIESSVPNELPELKQPVQSPQMTSQETKSEKMTDGRVKLKDIRSSLTPRQLNKIKRRQKKLRKQRGMEMTNQINDLPTKPRSTNLNIIISSKAYKKKSSRVKFQNKKHKLSPRALKKIQRETERLRKEKTKPSEVSPKKECVMKSGNMVEKVLVGQCSVGFCRVDGTLHYHKVI